MVRQQMDMLEYEEAAPDDIDGFDVPQQQVTAETHRKTLLIKEIAANGEAIITFQNKHTTEVHGDDTHFYPELGVFFTEDETPGDEEAETWYFAENVLSVQRH